MSEDELLKAGISAAKSGDIARATSLFAQAVKENPSSERGWYFLAMSCSAPDQREYCLRRVLTLNPNNAEAIKQLAGLSKPVSVSPAARAAPPAVPPINAPKPPAPVTTSPPVNESKVKSIPSEATDKKPHQIPAPQKGKSKKKNINQFLVLSVVGAMLLMVCGVGIVYVFFLNSPQPMVSMSDPLAATTSTETLIPLIVDTPTFTLAPPTAVPSPIPTVFYTPLVERSSCNFEVPIGADVDCGYVVVPEDRTGDSSHTIKLAFAVYHSASESPESVPVMFLQGGPGAGAVELSAQAYENLVMPFLAERDFIVFDQRGTGLSVPALKCDELTKAYSQDIHGLIPSDARKMVYSNAFLSCSGLLSALNVDLNAYTTVASAADLKDILAVLGYQKVNLYGASYGTRLALVTMRDYPEIVQSVILDSVVPVDANLFAEYPLVMESALRAMFDSCAASPECNGAYPNLETVFHDLVNELNANPVTVTTSALEIGEVTESVTGSTLTSIILGSLKNSYLINTAPQTIYRVRDGDYSTLIAAEYSLPFAFEDINPGLYVSMICHEHILATTVDELGKAASREDIKEYALLPFYGDADDIFKTCKSWGAVPPAYGENNPVTSDIPTLVIAGKYDSATPPFYGKQVAGQLSKSYYFEFPNQGHTPTASGGCAMDTVLAFLKDPAVEPSRDCLNGQKEVAFLTPYTGSPLLSLDTIKVMGVSVDVPEDWYGFGDGFLARGSSPLDITQIGIVKVDIGVAELKDWFSLSAYGYRGLDTAPISAGQRSENSLKWTLYTSTSNGRPVDIAMANYQGGSLMIMMFCHKDEHDALYRTVFLPIVDSAR
ncbi:MAG: alpha/beta hydrolase [Chloroflexi bacterium]|nr:alpha/beta hydrolase [Chloroflexota bacterium]